MEQSYCNGHKQVIDERFARDKERLDKQESRQERIETLTVQMGEILKSHNSKLDNHDDRISELEGRPGKLWDRLVGAALGAIGTGLAGALVVLILK